MAFAKILFTTQKFRWINLLKLVEGNNRSISSKGVTNSLINSETITQDLKMAANSRQVLDMVSTHLPQFQSQHIIQTLKILFHLQKQGSTEDIINNEDFLLLCRRLKSECRSMDINDSIEALKIITYLGVPSSSVITQTLLHLIKHSINSLSLQHVIFLDFLFRKFSNPTPLVEALLIALPLVFQIQLQTVIDHDNINELVEYLQYASKNSLPSNCIQSIISALTLHGKDLPIYAAKSVMWSLCDMERLEISCDRLLENMFKVLKENIMMLSYEDMETTVSKLLHKCIKDNPNFYDDEFFDKCAEYIIINQCDLMKAIWITRKLTRMAHVNIPLLNYIGEKITENPESMSRGRPAIFFTTVAAYSFADYKPKNWDIIKKAILDSKLLLEGKDELPWTKCAVDLAVLDCFDDNLIRRIFNPEFLNKYLARDFNILDHLQLLHMHQAVKTLYTTYEGPFLSPDVIKHALELCKPQGDSPFKPALIKALGEEKFVASGVLSRLGHVIDHVVVMRNGQPVPVCPAMDQDTMYIEDIVTPEDSTIICVMCLYKGCYSANCHRLRGSVNLQIRTLEALGYEVLSISIQTWKKLDDREKIPYLLQGINEKSTCNMK